MKTRDILGYAFGAIKMRKLRSALTTAGIIIGIAAIVALLSVTQGLEATLVSTFQQGLSANVLTVTGNNIPLYANYTNQIMAIPSVSQYITAASPVIAQAGYITNSSRSTLQVTIVGFNFTEVEEDYPAIFAYVEAGSIPLNPPDNAVVVGAKISNLNLNGTIFVNVGDPLYVTTQVPIANKTYIGNVTAVLKPVGFSYGGPSDTGVYIPINQAEKYFGTDQLSQIIVILKNSNNDTITKVSNAITNYFKGQVTVESSAAIISTIRSAISSTDVVVVGIAAISLLVAGVSIMNIMIVSTIERTREIGILKALGMKSRTVLTTFLCESAITGLIGALAGLGLGLGIANIIALVSPRDNAIQINGIGVKITPVLTPEMVILALVFGMGVSILFAVWPARRASKLEVVDALRYE
ncbi:MAG TPA: FtsX-like permease family protein [Candidatus Bathyarchaeia archaeon]|nr:FtsX-like permease family protein [Candidatus Bathyarchaeia archaeon]